MTAKLAPAGTLAYGTHEVPKDILSLYPKAYSLQVEQVGEFSKAVLLGQNGETLFTFNVVDTLPHGDLDLATAGF